MSRGWEGGWGRENGREEGGVWQVVKSLVPLRNHVISFKLPRRAGVS